MHHLSPPEKRTARVPAEPSAKKSRNSARIVPAAAEHRKDLVLTPARNEHRVDTRLLAHELRNRHKNVLELVERYRGHFARFGVVPFQTEKPTGAGGGRPERYALLNEDQAFFLLSLSRNTDHVVELKARLVAAFQAARKAAEIRQTEYLPIYHQLHEALHSLADGATHERFVHLNVNRLINKVAGVAPGTRERASVPRQGMLIAAQVIAAHALRGAPDHREGYERVKAALAPLQACAVDRLGVTTD
jgi:phage regulator Rha-like protein